MTIGFVASALLGIVLGLRFRVFSLVPLTLLTLLAGALAAFHFQLDAMTVLTTVGMAILGLQIGYICGSFGASITEQPASAVTAAHSPGRYRIAGNVKR